MDLIKLQLKYKKELKKLEILRFFFTNIFFIMWMWPILSGLSGAIFIVLAYAVNIINLQDWAIVLIIIIIFLSTHIFSSKYITTTTINITKYCHL